MLKTNTYFDGRVKSIAFDDNGPATVGVMDVGEYEFGTTTKEIITVIAGAMEVKLPGRDRWQVISAGESFEVGKDQRFGVKTNCQTAYLCCYR